MNEPSVSKEVESTTRIKPPSKTANIPKQLPINLNIPIKS
tara:strand:+ start:1229 stop:1348 length:120 start_codon:yes stop_codon:yes gene_type:complete